MGAPTPLAEAATFLQAANLFSLPLYPARWFPGWPIRSGVHFSPGLLVQLFDRCKIHGNDALARSRVRVAGMKQLVQSYRTGRLDLLEVPAPAPREGYLVVRTRASLV